MAGLPKFSAGQIERLKKLQLADSQIEQLRYACMTVKVHVQRPAARNDVAELLREVETLAEKLLRKSTALALPTSSAHAHANSLVEIGYWQARPDDEGATSFLSAGPRIRALRDAPVQDGISWRVVLVGCEVQTPVLSVRLLMRCATGGRKSMDPTCSMSDMKAIGK